MPPPMLEPEAAPKIKRRKQETLLQFYTPSKSKTKETGLWSIDSWNGSSSLFSPLAKIDEMDKPEFEFTAQHCKRKEKFNKFTRSYEMDFGGHKPQVIF
jgi:hypothetical protein